MHANVVDGLGFAGYASVFNVIDRQGDVVERGAFEGATHGLGSQRIALLIGHNMMQMVGCITLLQEDEYGLFVEGIIDMRLPKSIDLVRAIIEHRMLNFSIGYCPRSSRRKAGINYITSLDLIEISFVERPANVMARLINVDNIYIDRDIESLMAQVNMLCKKHKMRPLVRGLDFLLPAANCD